MRLERAEQAELHAHAVGAHPTDDPGEVEVLLLVRGRAEPDAHDDLGSERSRRLRLDEHSAERDVLSDALHHRVRALAGEEDRQVDHGTGMTALLDHEGTPSCVGEQPNAPRC